MVKHFLFTVSCIPFVVSAARFPIRHAKRDSFGIAHTTNLTDNQDLVYIANITIANQSFPVQLDTGSSDLWIATNDAVPGKQTNLSVNLTYAIGYAAGVIATAPVTFAGYNISSQAFLVADNVHNAVLVYGAKGVLGLGFTGNSVLDFEVSKGGGRGGKSVLWNIFALDASTPNMMAVSLQRSLDPNDEEEGSFTIGEYDPKFSSVANTPTIPTFPSQNPPRWAVLLDQLFANGKKLSLNSTGQDTPSGSAVTLLDTGTSYAFAPTYIVNEIYGSIAGAKYNESLQAWIVPCDEEVDITLYIGGRKFDMHPLDTVQPIPSDPNTCTGTWLPLLGPKSDFDYILGDAILRSIYTVFYFGDFNSNHKMGDPYVRLLSVVHGPNASIDFHQVRGGNSSSFFLSNVDSNTSALDPNISINDLNNKVNSIMKWVPVAIGVVGLNALILLVVLIVSVVACVRRRKYSRVPTGSFFPGGSTHDYRPISLQQFAPSEAPHKDND